MNLTNVSHSLPPQFQIQRFPELFPFAGVRSRPVVPINICMSKAAIVGLILVSQQRHPQKYR